MSQEIHDFTELLHLQFCTVRVDSFVPVHLCVLSCFSRVHHFATPWTAARQALSMGFSRQEYWRGLPCPPPGDLPNPGIELESLMSSALARGFFFFFLTTSATWVTLSIIIVHFLETSWSLLILLEQRLGTFS